MLASLCGPGYLWEAESSACECRDPNYYVSGSQCLPYFSAGVSGSGPWGIWRAQFFNPSTGALPEARGFVFRGVTSSGPIGSGSGSGAGATASVNWIGGGTSSQLSWNAVPSSSEFTICTLTRYTGNNKGRILTLAAPDGNYDRLYGHHSGRRGVCYMRDNDRYVWLTAISNRGETMNWLVMCSQNGASITPPNNIIADGTMTHNLA